MSHNDYDLDLTPLCIGFDIRLHDIQIKVDPTMRTAITPAGPIVAETVAALVAALRRAGYHVK